jgi:aminopeptidase-like protein
MKQMNMSNYGSEMHNLIKELYPICRSITGNGVRKTLSILQKYLPIQIKEVKSGTRVFDWTVPKEWNIKDAYIKNSKGKRIVDFKKSNLHVLNYSIPVNKTMKLKDLKKRLYSLENYPNWIPYLTTYYAENWGFCISQKQMEKLKEEDYKVVIDSELKQGFLTYGELFIKGKTEKEVLFSTYLCHPSLCNDNLSGVVLTTFLAKQLLDKDLNYSYRFLFIPETIGAITWLSLNEKNVSKITHGIVITCVGDSGNLTYKKSRRGNAAIDKIVEKVLCSSDQPHEIIDFFPSGSDERQYCSPGFNLPIGSLIRTPYGKFPEYHTSADNLDFVKKDFLADSLEKYIQVINEIEKDKIKDEKPINKRPKKDSSETFINLNPKCEPQLGKRGLYKLIGSSKNKDIEKLAIFWVLNLSDGNHSLKEITNKSKINYKIIKSAAEKLVKKNLLEKVNA